MDSKDRNLLSQLSGLRLSDGSLVSDRLGKSSTPETISSFNTKPTAKTAPSSSSPAVQSGSVATKLEDSSSRNNTSSSPKTIKEVNNNNSNSSNKKKNRAARAVKVPSDGQSSSSPPAVEPSQRPKLSVTERLNRLMLHNKDFKAANGNASSSHANHSALATPSASLAVSSVVAQPGSAAAPVDAKFTVPKPRSVDTAASPSSLVPVKVSQTVADFLHNVAAPLASPPPVVSAAALKTAIVVSADTNSEESNAVKSNSKSQQPQSGEKALASKQQQQQQQLAVEKNSALPAMACNEFLVRAFGPIDNLHSTKPIIREAPAVPEDGRYIIVGDVHGCVDQLEALVEKVKYNRDKDCLIIVGDYVNKGPYSEEVIRTCQRLGAYGTLGNHDFTLLGCCMRMRRRPFTPEDLRDPVKRLAQVFPKECEYYLRGLPHILRIPGYNLLVVHAGLNLQHSLEHQDTNEIMNMRRLEEVSNASTGEGSSPTGKAAAQYRAVVKGKKGLPWAALWKGPEHVIFGHDAIAGFQSHDFACGIDTGCVYGGPLTCAVFSKQHVAGEYFSVPGLPDLVNELKGLPPPTSAIYELQGMDIDKLIIRPTSRATPSVPAPGVNGRPVFLSAPLGYTEAESSVAVTTPAVPKTTSMTTTITSTNARFTPSAVFPSRLATPTCPANVQLMETASANAREVQRATLLALSATRQLSAISVLMTMPIYMNEIDVMMANEVDDVVAQEAFWVPFITHIMERTIALSKGPDADTKAAETAVYFALEVCDAMPAVCKRFQDQLRGIAAAGSDHGTWPKRISKYAQTLLD